jgi:hypothetical protein
MQLSSYLGSTEDYFIVRRWRAAGVKRPKFNTQMRKDFHAAYRLAMGDRFSDDLYFARGLDYEYSWPKARQAWNLWQMAVEQQKRVVDQLKEDNATLIRTQIKMEMEIMMLRAELV